MTSTSVIVIGAGVLGLASAAELAARGHSVTVIDPGGPNASSVAAGMIAPAMESALDDPSPAVVAALKAARALWPEFATRHGVTLIEDGAEWRGPGGEAVAARLAHHGFRVERIEGALRTPDDARVEVDAAMSRLEAAVPSICGSVVSVQRAAHGWCVRLDDGRELATRNLLLATGAAPTIDGLPDKVSDLVQMIAPIRGQISHVSCALAHVVRTTAGYAVPVANGTLIGASMEPGRDLNPDSAAARTQVLAVSERIDLMPGKPDVRVGIRGAFADGLPAVGMLDGVLVALAPRRNGWLLAPLVARVVADAIQGAPRGEYAAALDPTRSGLATAE